MNSTSNNGNDGKPMDTGLQKISHAWSRLDQDEPPELLDQAILNSAHRAVEKKAKGFQFGWLHGLTTAAVFVLALGIVLQQRPSVPQTENGVLTNEELLPVFLDTVSKKRTDDDRSTEMLELRSEPRINLRGQQAAPVAVDADTPTARTPIEVMDLKQSVTTPERARSKTLRTSLPATSAQTADEEVTEDKAESLHDTVLLLQENNQLGVSTASGPTEIMAEPEKAASILAKLQLLDIIELKKAGDESWKTALSAFIDAHPDYPLPDELVD